MTENDALRSPGDTWGSRQIISAGLLGAGFAAYLRVLDFWSFDSTAWLLFDLLALPILMLSTLVLVLTWLVGAAIAGFRRRFRRMTTNIAAIAIVPAGFLMVALLPLFDPWLWYVIANKARLEGIATATASTRNTPRFAIVEERDVSSGIAGIAPNHFVTLVYDENDPDKRGLSDPEQKHIYGNFYRRDYYQ